jgi:hypothetical protein
MSPSNKKLSMLIYSDPLLHIHWPHEQARRFRANRLRPNKSNYLKNLCMNLYVNKIINIHFILIDS